MTHTGTATIAYNDSNGDEIDFCIVKNYIVRENSMKTTVPLGCKYITINIKLNDEIENESSMEEDNSQSD